MKRVLLLLLFISVSLLGCSNNKARDDNEQLSQERSVHYQKHTQSPKKYNVCFYLENSGSMRGYIHRGNKFERTLCSMESELSISNIIKDNPQLFYINKEIVKTPQNLKFNDYVYNVLNPQKYQKRSSTGESSFSTMFDMILQRTDKSTLSIFVSDCIFSVGKADANQYIATEKDNIKKLINKKIKQDPDFSILVYCFQSNFNGYFYNHVDAKQKINADRPFYVWVFGEKDAIAQFRRVVSEDKIENKIMGEYLFNNTFKTDNLKNIWTSIVSTSAGKASIKEVSRAKLQDGKFRITLLVDLKDYECFGNKYLLNKNNYRVLPMQYKIVSIKKRQVNRSTHMITIETTQKIRSTMLRINLNNSFPLWVDQYNIKPNDSDAIFKKLNKTYGIKSIMMGVYDGFDIQNDVIGSMKISINQK